MRSRTVVISCQTGCSGEPACITAHDLHDDNTWYLVDVSVVGNLQHGGCNILGCRAKSWSVVGMAQVIVNGLRDADDLHIRSDLLCILAEFIHCIHRVVATDIVECSNLIFLKSVKYYLIRF